MPRIASAAQEKGNYWCGTEHTYEPVPESLVDLAPWPEMRVDAARCRSLETMRCFSLPLHSVLRPDRARRSTRWRFTVLGRMPTSSPKSVGPLPDRATGGQGPGRLRPDDLQFSAEPRHPPEVLGVVETRRGVL